MKDKMEESQVEVKSEVQSGQVEDENLLRSDQLTRWSSSSTSLHAATSDSDLELRTFNEDFSRNSEEINRIMNLEQEQEKLTNSLLQLTSHFAQVQFRLKQIIKSPSDQWTNMLKSLEEFAFQGIPEIPDCSEEYAPKLSSDEAQRVNQIDMIDQLKTQLEDLEKFAFESGDLVLPQTILFEKQKIIIDELKKKINFPIEDSKLAHLSPDELKTQIDSAVGELVNPIKMKDHLVSQLKTQINDLERFINYIQNEEIPENVLAKANCDCSSETHNQKKVLLRKNSKNKLDQQQQREMAVNFGRNADERTLRKEQEPGLLPRIYTLFEMFTTFHLSNQSFKKNVLKKTTRGNHWGDIRAQLEMNISEIFSHMNSLKSSEKSNDCRQNASILVNLVRKKMALSLRDLIQHGMSRVTNNQNNNTIMVPFISCFSSVPKNMDDYLYDYNSGGYGESTPMHAWDLILEYYYSHNGDKFNQTPAVKLSQSFNLDLMDESSISVKKSLLTNIGNIISIHAPYKSSSNAHFKSFVCAGLNAKKLAKWLKLIVQNNDLVGTFYESWSYTVQTGFQDSLRSIERLSSLQFQLPLDLAVRQFENINDVFM